MCVQAHSTSQGDLTYTRSKNSPKATRGRTQLNRCSLTSKGADLVAALLRHYLMVNHLHTKGLSSQNNEQIYSRNKFTPLESMVYKENFKLIMQFHSVI